MQIAVEEFLSSQEKGFPIVWKVSTAYHIQNGILIRESGPPKKVYAPITHLELPSEISKLQMGDEAGLLNFVHTYGELGYVGFTDRKNKKRKGDPISWIWNHAQTIRLCLELINALKNKDEQLINTVLSSKKYQGKWPELIKIAKGPFQIELMVWLGQRAKGGLINQTEKLLFSIINGNIEKLHPKLVSEEERPQLPFTFSALVEVAYWQLANTYVGGWLRRCEACGALFQQTDQRQQFCPKGLRQESLCASRDRLKRFRENQKAAKGSKRTSSKNNKRKGGESHGKKKR